MAVPSGSKAGGSVPASAVSSGVAVSRGPATGASLTGPTATVTVASTLPPWPSSTRTWKVSVPLKSGFGL